MKKYIKKKLNDKTEHGVLGDPGSPVSDSVRSIKSWLTVIKYVISGKV